MKTDRKAKAQSAAYLAHMKEQRARAAAAPSPCPNPGGKPGLAGCETCGAMAGEDCQRGAAS
jgi:hypothetical protein